MPEGPEVWILSITINKLYLNNNTYSIGKHLLIKDLNEDWSFGLNGKVSISKSISTSIQHKLIKIGTGWINGDIKAIKPIKPINDWMQATKEELQEEINKWINSRKKLAGLILDGNKISGIGVAWGSEILYDAKLNPDIKACDQNLNKLVDSMIKIREQIKEIYIEYINLIDPKDVINNWFENLYKTRKMNIYKKGTKLEVLGRTWWI